MNFLVRIAIWCIWICCSCGAVSGSTVKHAWIVRLNRNADLLQCDQGWRLQRSDMALVTVQPTEDTLVIAHATYDDIRSENGFGEIMLVANQHGSESERRYAVGALEAFLTADLIAALAKNAKSMRIQSVYNQTIEHLVDWHSKVVERASNNGQALFWQYVSLVLERLDGMDEILNHPCASIRVSREDLIALQNDGDIGDIEQLYKYLQEHSTNTLKTSIFLSLTGKKSNVAERASQGMSTGSVKAAKNDAQFWERLLTKSKCSAIVRMTDNGEVLLGHATWANYVEMIRLVKHVDYGNGRKTTYSGFAGMIASTDDWYVNSNGMAIMETSLNIIDARSFNTLDKDRFVGIPSWIRTVVATENAASAKEWIDFYSQEFSGTYNCQWMILDRKKKNASRGLFTVFETMPGAMHFEDLTAHLKETRFFSSQNTPLFESVRDAAFYPKTEHQLATGVCEPCRCHYSYDNNPRGCIFKRDFVNVNSAQDMQHLMRSNSWRTDALSLGKPHNAIAGRFDLADDSSSAIPCGAIDAKVMSLFDDESFASHDITAGVTVNDQCPRFSAWDLFTQQGLSFDAISGLTGDGKWFRTKRFVL